MRITRRAEPDDLAALLKLYLHLNPGMPILSDNRSQHVWAEMLSDNHIAVFVRKLDDALVASCTLITAPNLMRGATPHAFLENVVTHRDFRRQGHGQAVINAALAEAWARGCAQVLLVTGRHRADPSVMDFYQSCGFEAGKAGLVAQRPTSAL